MFIFAHEISFIPFKTFSPPLLHLQRSIFLQFQTLRIFDRLADLYQVHYLDLFAHYLTCFFNLAR